MEKQQRNVLIGLVAILVVSALIWWGTQNPEQETKGQVIKLGVLMPLSAGTGSFYGEYGRRGLELALERINQEGGVIGRELQLVYENSGGKPKVGVEAFNKLVNRDKVKVVIGDQISGVTLAVAPVAEQRRILYIVPGSAAPKVAQAGDYVFRTKVSADIESKAAAEFLVSELKIKKVAFLYQNSDYGLGVFNALAVDLQKKGVQVVTEELFEIGSRDMRTQLTKLKNSDAEYILIAAYPQETGIILRQAKQIGVPQQFFAHSGSIGPDTMQEAGEAANGLLHIYEIKLDPSRPETRDFMDRYRAKYGAEPELFSSLAYDTLILLKAIMESCSGDNPDCLKSALYATQDFTGVTGVISFDENGDIRRDVFTPMTIRNEKPVLLPDKQ